jgi:hypothetical protein
VLDWFKKNWPYLLGIISGPFGLAAGFIIKHFDQVKRAALAVVRAVKHAIQQLLAWVRSLPGKVGHELGRIPGVKQAIGAGKAVGSAVGGAAGAVGDIFKQSGGYVGHGGRYIVGERGPEIVTLPAGATVTAHGALAAMPPTSAWAGRPLEITVPVYLDAREIARSTARVAADQLARR